MKTVAAGAERRIKVPLLTSSTIGAPLAATWLAPPRNGLVAFCGATATAPRPSVVGAVVWAAAGGAPKAAKISDPARPISKARIKDLETQVATR